MSLQDLRGIQPVYVLPRDSLITGVLIPCFRQASSVQCMVGFFSSSALVDIAPGLAHFIQRGEGQLRLLISPMVSEDDRRAIREGLTTPPELLAARLVELIGELRITERALARHTLACLAYLLSVGRIQIKVTLVRDGLFHPKAWIFSDHDDQIVAHGSSNLTTAGLTSNLEHVTVARSWADKTQAEVVRILSDEFEAVWNGERDYAVTVELPDAIKDQILTNFGSDDPPAPEDLWRAWKEDHERGLVGPPPGDAKEEASAAPHQSFDIPASLDYEAGDFAHQSKAVAAWEEAGRQGILEMATGSGKTVTALIAARRLFDSEAPLLVVIAAPFLPLIAQWETEASRFGLSPVVPGREATKRKKLARAGEAVRRLKLGVSRVECIVVTHDFLCDPESQKILEGSDAAILLIADEVHNLGRPGFLERPPEFFSHRLGLSATPERQYDSEGTSSLFGFFGDVVFRFTLAEAIGVCLVPYEYHVHPIYLSGDELEKWLALSAKLARLGWGSGSGDESANIPERVKLLLIQRRRVLEEAEEKIGVLHELLAQAGIRTIRHTLIYATDKGPSQLQGVNALLDSLGILYHQLTSSESAQPGLSGRLLESFAQGNLQVLTAKRVLDEGVDIPEVTTGFILASTTVERQWVQRRGRLLRKCSTIDKQVAHIHDFLVLPPPDSGYSETDLRRLVGQELTRVTEFARLATNAGASGGPLEVTQPLYRKYFVTQEGTESVMRR